MCLIFVGQTTHENFSSHKNFSIYSIPKLALFSFPLGHYLAQCNSHTNIVLMQKHSTHYQVFTDLSMHHCLHYTDKGGKAWKIIMHGPI